VLLVGYGAEDRVYIRKGVGPRWWFVPLGMRACEENVVEVRVIYMELMRADSDYWAF
jgi:hypothetical protein